MLWQNMQHVSYKINIYLLLIAAHFAACLNQKQDLLDAYLSFGLF